MRSRNQVPESKGRHMKMMKRLPLAGVMCCAVASGGCSSVMTHTGASQGYYPGTRASADILTDSQASWALKPTALVDLPFLPSWIRCYCPGITIAATRIKPWIRRVPACFRVKSWHTPRKIWRMLSPCPLCSRHSKQVLPALFSRIKAIFFHPVTRPPHPRTVPTRCGRLSVRTLPFASDTASRCCRK